MYFGRYCSRPGGGPRMPFGELHRCTISGYRLDDVEDQDGGIVDHWFQVE